MSALPSKQLNKAATKMRQEQAEREFIASLPPDRFGVNPPDTRPIVPKGPRKGSKRKMEGG